MQRTPSLKVGGFSAAIGATGIFFGNFLHPFPPDDRAAMLAMVAAEPLWSAMHLWTMCFAIAILFGLVALADSLDGGPAAPLARAGRVVAQVGVPVMLVGVAIDGYGFKVLADAWAAADEPARSMMLHAADAVVIAETGIVHTWVTFFLGMSFALFGLALLRAKDHPRWLGWLGFVAGFGCIASGVTAFLRLPVTLPFPFFATGILAWSAAVGVLMVRRAGGTA